MGTPPSLAVSSSLARVARGRAQAASNRKSFLHPEFREALLTVAGDSGNINGRRLGKWLSANKGNIVNGLRIVGDGTLEGIARYRLQCLRDEKWE